MYDYLLSLRTGVARDNLSQSKIKNIDVIIPPITIQQKIVEEIEILEAQIATAQNIIDNAPAQKAAILKKWLE